MTTSEPAATQTLYFNPGSLDAQLLQVLGGAAEALEAERPKQLEDYPFVTGGFRRSLAKDTRYMRNRGVTSMRHGLGFQETALERVPDRATLLQLIADGMLSNIQLSELVKKFEYLGVDEPHHAVFLAEYAVARMQLDPRTVQKIFGFEAESEHIRGTDELLLMLVHGREGFAHAKSSAVDVSETKLTELASQRLYSGPIPGETFPAESLIAKIVGNYKSTVSMQLRSRSEVDPDAVFDFLDRHQDFSDFAYLAEMLAEKGTAEVRRLAEKLAGSALPYTDEYIELLAQAIEKQLEALIQFSTTDNVSENVKVILNWNKWVKESPIERFVQFDIDHLHEVAIARGISAYSEVIRFGLESLSAERAQVLIDENRPDVFAQDKKRSLLNFILGAPEDIAAVFLDDTQKESGSSNRQWTQSSVISRMEKGFVVTLDSIEDPKEAAFIKIFQQPEKDFLLDFIPAGVKIKGLAADYVARQALDALQDTINLIESSNGGKVAKGSSSRLKTFLDAVENGRVESTDVALIAAATIKNTNVALQMNHIPTQVPLASRAISEGLGRND